MDIFTHGLWGGLFFGNSKRKGMLKYGFIFGILPDLIAFVPHVILQIMMGQVIMGKPPLNSFPDWVFVLYNTTHSLVIGIVLWIIIKKIWGRSLATAFLAWPLHILMDIPTHTSDFFPTKFLYPLSHFHFDGVSWSHPRILTSNYILLILAYGVFLYKNKKKSYRRTQV